MVAGIYAAASLTGLTGVRAQPSETTLSTVKSPTPPRVRGYGRRRLFGAKVLFEDTPSGDTVDVYAFADGRSDGVEQVYLNDDKVTVSGGFVQALPDFRYQSNHVLAGFNLGLATETAFAAVMSRLPGQWTSAHRGDGVTSGYLIKRPEKSRSFLKTYPQGDNVELSAVFRLQRCFDPRTATTVWTENPVLHLLDYLVNQRGYDYATRIAPTEQYWIDAANICDEPVPLKSGSVVVTIGANVVASTVQLSSVLGLAVGQAITFFNSSGQTQTRTVSNISGGLVDVSAPFTININTGSYATFSGGGTEPRYRGCVTYASTAQPKEVIGSLLQCFDGWTAPRGDGAIVVYAGKLYAPTVTLGPDQIINYNLPYGVASESRVDELAVSYVSAPHDYSQVDTTAWGEPGLRTDSFAPQVPSHAQARRLAKREYARTNEFNRGSITTNLGGRIARGQRFINLLIEESGIVFFEGVVEITNVKRNFLAGGLSIDWVAVDENIDEWNPATEEGDPAALGDRYAPLPLDPPVIDTAVAFFESATDDGTGARVRVTVDTPAPRDDYTWYIRWKRAADTAWKEERSNDEGVGGQVTLTTGLVPTLNDLEVQVLYAQGDGRDSPWSATETVNASTDAEVPDDSGAPTLLDWRTILRIDVPRISRARSYRWRIYEDDGTTLIRTVNTSTNVLEYTPGQAAADGIRRSYVVTVAGVNSAGEGAIATTGVITNAAPPQVTGVVATGGDYIPTIEFDALTDPDLAGYVLFYSQTDDFDPTSEGFAELRGPATTQQIYALGAGTYYVRVAGYDGWSHNPALLNLSDEANFVIAIGTSGGIGGVGGGGGGGGIGGGGDIKAA